MELAIFNKEGKDTGNKAKLSSGVFGIEPSEHAMYLDVKQFLAANRQGTHKAKERAEIAGSTRKIKKQKGTGTARAGSIKNPLFRGGGRVFGPKPRDYDFKLNKKLKLLARKSALSAKLNDNEISIVENFDFEAPKTKLYEAFLSNFEMVNKKSLLVLDGENKNIFLSSRNLKGAKTVNCLELNTYDIINADKVFISEKALGKIEETLS